MNHRFLDVDAYSTTDIARMLGLGISVAYIKSCGISPIIETNTATLWFAADYPRICLAIAQKLIAEAARQ